MCSVPDEGGYGYDDKEEGLLSSEDKGLSLDLEVWYGGGDKRNQKRLEGWEKGGGRPMQSWR